MLKGIRRVNWWPVLGLMLCMLSALVTVSLIAVAVVAAQEVIPGLPNPADQSQAVVIAVFAAVLPFGVALLRKLVPTMPRILVWSLPPILGALIAWGTALPLSGWQGLAAGLIAIAFREAASTLKEHGING